MGTATAPTTDIVNELKQLWKDFQIVEKKGLAFGKRLYVLREVTIAQGNHSGAGFLQNLQQAGIPQRTAYYWIHGYEISIGERVQGQEKPAPKKEPVIAESVPQSESVSQNEDIPQSEIDATVEQTLTAEPHGPVNFVVTDANLKALTLKLAYQVVNNSPDTLQTAKEIIAAFDPEGVQ